MPPPINYEQPLATDVIGELPTESLDFLRNVQANVLKSDGRRCIRLLFFQLPVDDIKKARDYIASMARRRVSTMYSQLSDVSTWRAKAVSGRGLASIGLTGKGMVALGLDSSGQPNDPSFIRGMLNKVDLQTFGDAVDADGAPIEWETAYKADEIHGMWLVGDTSAKAVDALADGIESEGAAFGIKIVAREKGEKRDVEPFGFRDGLSMPEFFSNGLSEAGNADRAFRKVFPLKCILIFNGDREAAGPLSAFNGGSYVVFRKLEQHVAQFKKTVARLARERGCTDDDVGAMIVGRRPDGTPMAEMSGDGRDLNDFNFSADAAGDRCPYQAHIRKANPRDTHFSNIDVIARRSCVYEQEGKTGLLFMGYVAGIQSGFNAVQGSWINDPNFPQEAPRDRVGVDALIDQSPLRTLKAARPLVDLPAFVTPRGGVYLFIPPMSWFSSLL